MCRFFLDPVFRLIDLFTLIPSHSVMTPIASQKLLKSCKVRSSKFVFLDQNCFGCFRFLALPHIFYNCHFPQKSNLTFTGIALDVFQGICPINLSSFIGMKLFIIFSHYPLMSVVSVMTCLPLLLICVICVLILSSLIRLAIGLSSVLIFSRNSLLVLLNFFYCLFFISSH